MAENMPEDFAHEIEKGYKRAVNQYTGSESTSNRWNKITSNLDGIFEILEINVDYPGLYPAFTIKRNGKTIGEYSPLNAIRQYNNYWNHWQKS